METDMKKSCSSNMLFGLASRILILGTATSASMAQELRPDSVFNGIASENVQFAISASYSIGGKAPVVFASGPTEKGGSITVAQDARWHIGSISKSFTSTLVMRLVDRGVLELDVPIGNYLTFFHDEMHPAWELLSLRQLLSHTSGLPANASPRVMRETSGMDAYTGRRVALSSMWGTPPSGQAGKFIYSNIGYVLAGLVIEEVTGASWESTILTEIAQPLGLSSLGFGAPQEPNDPRGHKSVFGFKRSVSPSSPSSDNPKWMGPAGTIHLSLADLATWGQAHIRACAGKTPNFLSQSRCMEMQTPIAADYGLGWAITKSGSSGTIVWHSGSNTMWYALLHIVPQTGLSVAAATNVYAPEQIDKLVRELSELLIDGS
ncbi:serine hydrolase domain-containing protein [Pseudophaeobacter sp.]|uniref:serine hydrolase domain-containing protein n=1 Tax=Pseudophaeobacter sp. TaxID=1971739 RepID=UPI00329A3328